MDNLTLTKKWLYAAILALLLLSLSMGAWWIYVMVHLYDIYQEASKFIGPPSQGRDIMRMIKWEGPAFFVTLLLLITSLFYLFILDSKRTKGMQRFFAAFGHELKTPLTNIQLQAEILKEKLEFYDELEKNNILKAVNRLITSSKNLTYEIQELMQLSRVELGGQVYFQKISIKNFLENWIKSASYEITIKLSVAPTFPVVDEILAEIQWLHIIFSNLVQNTIKHQHKCKLIAIDLSTRDSFVVISYQDFGTPFKGDPKKVAELFYTGPTKNDSNNSTGLGLYLIKKMIYKMHGQINFKFSPHFEITIKLPLASGEKYL